MPLDPVTAHNAAVKAAATRKANKARAAAQASGAYGGYVPPVPPPNYCKHGVLVGSGCSQCNNYNAAPKAKTYAPPPPPAPKVDPLPDTPRAAVLVALAKLEDALVLKAASRGVTAEFEKQFQKYQSIKARALSPTNWQGSTSLATAAANEANVALKMALKTALDLVF